MQSPFKILRKHQKVILAGLTLMAMIGFGVGDTLVRMVRVGSANRVVKNEVETNVGSLSQTAMHNLMVQRMNLQRFIGMAYQKSHADLIEKNPFIARFLMPRIIAEYGFGGTSKPELLFSWLHRHEARKMGIVVSDSQIEDYIGRITEHKLSSKKLQEIVDDMHMSPKELFDSFRDELEAQIAYRMKAPSTIPSPEKYWEYYQQLNTREVIEAARVLPVADFTDKVPDPDAAQIATLFEKHKNDFEQAFDAKFIPGFRQPHKVKLHYLTIGPSAVEDKLKAMGQVTDQEIEEYYEKKKDIDLRLQDRSLPPLGDNDPMLPEFAAEKGPALDADKGDQPDAGDEKEGSDEAKPPADKGSGKGEKSQDDGKKKTSGDESSCFPATSSGDDDETQKSDAKSAADDPDDASDDDKKPEKPKKTAKKTAAGDDDEKPDGDEPSDEKEQEGDEQPAGKGPTVNPGKPARPKIKYKPLDEDLRDLIRDAIVNERRQKLLKELSAKAVKALQDVGLSLATSSEIKLSDPNPEQLEKIQRRSEAELRKIASTLDVKFDKTDLVSQLELSDVPGLGKSLEPFAGEAMQAEPTTILEQAFGRGSSEALCRIYQSEGADSTSYIWWKVQDVPAHVPKLDDAGIRQQVVKAWKRLESIPLAKKRAEELAEKASGDEELTKALAGETVTGDPQSLAIIVSGPSAEFSFYQDSSAPDPMRGSRGPDVRFGNPIIVTGAYRKFMLAVFNSLGVGQVGAVLNDDATVCYVVRVISRRDADREAFKDAPLFDRSTPYEQLAQIDHEEAAREYASRLREKYAIKWNELAARETGPIGDEE